MNYYKKFHIFSLKVLQTCNYDFFLQKNHLSYANEVWKSRLIDLCQKKIFQESFLLNV